MSPLLYLQQTWEELKKVSWPSQQEVIRLTILVVFVSMVVGLYIGGIDFILTKIVELVVNK